MRAGILKQRAEHVGLVEIACRIADDQRPAERFGAGAQHGQRLRQRRAQRRGEVVIVALADRIELVVVAPGAGERDAEEGPADEDRGEKPSLADALADIRSIEIIADINPRVASYEGQLSGKDMLELRAAAMDRLAEIERK